ncbi:MAG: hypothetical protein GY828_08625 [Candidatus Gracilibacteria bacterium]|nr:hypothetical protein [Candidatus Gracilibacteria bacterium]
MKKIKIFVLSLYNLCDNNTNMDFTTTTEISRKGSKIFEQHDEAIVLHNNKNIGLLLGGELANAVLESGVLQQLREELWESQDNETKNLVGDYKEGKKSDSISLDDYTKKYAI